MNKLLNKINSAIGSFVKEEDGAQVVEYALIIAVVSIGLVLALNSNGGGLSAKFATFITRVGNCLALTTGTC